MGKDGNDRLDGGPGEDKLEGDRGADTLDGGPGEDDIDGGRGNDHLITTDASEEHTLACGQGTDQLDADARDLVNVDCEDYDGGRVSTGGATVTLLITCPGTCVSGRITLSAGGAPIGTGTFGTRASAAAVPRAAAPRVRLSARGKRLLRRHRTLKASARVGVVDANGHLYRIRGRYVLRRR